MNNDAKMSLSEEDYLKLRMEELSNFISIEFPGKCGESEDAIATAIRIMRQSKNPKIERRARQTDTEKLNELCRRIQKVKEMPLPDYLKFTGRVYSPSQYVYRRGWITAKRKIMSILRGK